MSAGDLDIERAVAELADDLPLPLRALARVAYDYRWSWSADGPALFAAIDPERWARSAHNPRRLLTETAQAKLDRAAGDAAFLQRVARLGLELAAERARPSCGGPVDAAHPVAFFCSEFEEI